MSWWWFLMIEQYPIVYKYMPHLLYWAHPFNRVVCGSVRRLRSFSKTMMVLCEDGPWEGETEARRAFRRIATKKISDKTILQLKRNSEPRMIQVPCKYMWIENKKSIAILGVGEALVMYLIWREPCVGSNCEPKIIKTKVQGVSWCLLWEARRFGWKERCLPLLGPSWRENEESGLTLGHKE